MITIQKISGYIYWQHTMYWWKKSTTSIFTKLSQQNETISISRTNKWFTQRKGNICCMIYFSHLLRGMLEKRRKTQTAMSRSQTPGCFVVPTHWTTTTNTLTENNSNPPANNLAISHTNLSVASSIIQLLHIRSNKEYSSMHN